MARNKNPEETQKRILDISAKLFIEKGYENTSIQDIINGLGDLSKGAIYHHFKSKEDILISLMNEMNEDIETPLYKICQNKTKNGAQKLKELFMESIFNVAKDKLFGSSPDYLKNPKMLVMQMNSTFYEVVPDYIAPIVEEGVCDGSIKTDYPRELAEVLIILANIWLNPLIYKTEDLEGLVRRGEFYRLICRKLGADIIDDELIQGLRHLGEIYYRKGEQ